MEIEKAIHNFLQAVWQKGNESGWPVNANEIGFDLFGGEDDVEAARKSTQNVIQKCQNFGYFEATYEGDIHRLSESAIILLENED